MADATEEELAWAADKRDFVADSRESTAATRDTVANVRELAADAREAELDEWQRLLEAAALKLGLPLEGTPASAARASVQAGRAQAADDRANFGRDREQAAVNRDEATKRQMAGGRPTLLALAFARIAEQLYNAQTSDEVLQRIAEAAVATITGCGLASVTLEEDGSYRTAASTGAAASAVDLLQYQVAQGPSLDALSAPWVQARSFPDPRWPLLAAGPAEHGIESAVTYRLNASPNDDACTTGGSLNTYALTPDAFDDTAREIGFVLAAHASLAARAVGERITLEGIGRQLEQALFTRDVIGQAKGILMERLRITPDDAFDVLRHSSQRLNAKLRDVARKLTETGELNQRVLRRQASARKA